MFDLNPFYSLRILKCCGDHQLIVSSPQGASLHEVVVALGRCILSISTDFSNLQLLKIHSYKIKVL